MPTVQLRFSDGVCVDAPVDSGQTVLEAGLAAGAPLLHQCKVGSCGACVAKLVSGETAQTPGRGSSLLPSEWARGQRLLCSSLVDADAVLDLAYDSQAGAATATSAHAFVNAVERIADDVIRLELELADRDWIDFRPGQFVQVQVPGSNQERRYSIASAPHDLPKIELLIRLLPGGMMSTWLLEKAAANDVVVLSGPYGGFFLKEGEKAPHILVAGGTGLAPMMAMLDVIRARPGRKPPILLSFGCQNADRLFHLEPIDLRRQWMPSLTTLISVDKGPAPAEVLICDPVAALNHAGPIDPASIAYLCGPPGLIEAARARLMQFGLSAERIHAEQFVASE
jgi:benzoate/toluate 1,2-dioxygenase reductase component